MSPFPPPVTRPPTAAASSVGEIAAELPADLAGRVIGSAERAPSGITHDSRAVAPGYMFAAVRGAHHDGHDHIAAALAAGAGSVLVDHEVDVPAPSPDVDVAQLVVADTRRALGPVAAAVYGHPSRRLDVVGITGTNGKTTTTHLLAAILEASGRRTGVLGTLAGAHTTPEAPDLQRRLATWADDGFGAVAMEVSSHAMVAHRVSGTRFAAVVFTNLGIDHLDLHGTAEAYFEAKASLFTAEYSAVAVVNRDDDAGRRLIDRLASQTPSPAGTIEVVTYGLNDATDVAVSSHSHSYRWRGVDIDVPIGGRFNVANSLAAATAAAAMGIDPATIQLGLSEVAPIPGRFEQVRPANGEAADVAVLVDYAHTPDGLVESIAAGREVLGPGGRLIVVFGAGGDRDHGKRPAMGEAGSSADVAIVTNDNPRSEVPETIAAAIMSGVPPERADRVSVVLDRRAAIAAAIEGARPGDLVIIAGKGHERTQTIGSTTIEFDDRAVARQLLEARP